MSAFQDRWPGAYERAVVRDDVVVPDAAPPLGLVVGVELLRALDADAPVLRARTGAVVARYVLLGSELPEQVLECEADRPRGDDLQRWLHRVVLSATSVGGDCSTPAAETARERNLGRFTTRVKTHERAS
jgi:hypothetical protein